MLNTEIIAAGEDLIWFCKRVGSPNVWDAEFLYYMGLFKANSYMWLALVLQNFATHLQ